MTAARAEAPLQRLEFVTATGAHEFRVEVAETTSQRARGLMYRREMPQDQGCCSTSTRNAGHDVDEEHLYSARHGVRLATGRHGWRRADATPLSESDFRGRGLCRDRAQCGRRRANRAQSWRSGASSGVQTLMPRGSACERDVECPAEAPAQEVRVDVFVGV